jgi:phospholipid/cholesterol/gamma-HCH transport system ATP-binding protein
LKIQHPFIQNFFLGERGKRALEVLDEHAAQGGAQPPEH